VSWADDADKIRTALEQGRAAARWRILCPCPFCEDASGKADRHGKLCVWPSGYTRCYRCAFQGFLDGHAPEGWEPEDRLEQFPDRPEPPDGFAPLYGAGWQHAHDGARVYLEGNRGLARAALREAGVGATLAGKYRGRVVMPVLDPTTKEWLTFVTRDFTGAPTVRAPYLTASTEDGWALREMVLFNEAALDAETDAPALVVEGCLDALWLWPDAVATLGDLSEWQVFRLARSRRPVVTVSDGDAWRKGWAVAERLKLMGARAGALRLPGGTDPDEVPHEAIREAALSALGD
jgi:hypothetical protein